MDFSSIGQKDAQGSISPLRVRIKPIWALRACFAIVFDVFLQPYQWPSTGGGARAKPSRLGWEENAREKWEVFRENASKTFNTSHNQLGVWGLGLFFFLISKSLSTVGQRVFFPWPQIGVVPGFSKAQGGPGRPREASRSLLRPAGSLLGPALAPPPWKIQERPRFGAKGRTPFVHQEYYCEFPGFPGSSWKTQ